MGRLIDIDSTSLEERRIGHRRRWIGHQGDSVHLRGGTNSDDGHRLPHGRR